jgi:hypothetical protein
MQTEIIGEVVPKKKENHQSVITAHTPEKRMVGGLLTNSTTDFVRPEDTLERRITIDINMKHPKSKAFVAALDRLIDEGMGNGLINYTLGV